MAEDSFGSSTYNRCAVRCYCDKSYDKEGCHRVFDTLEKKFGESKYTLDKNILAKTADAIEDRGINAREHQYDKNPIIEHLDGEKISTKYVPHEILPPEFSDIINFIDSKLSVEGRVILKIDRKTALVGSSYGQPGISDKTVRIYDLLKKYEAPEEMFKLLTKLPPKKEQELILTITAKPEDLLLKSTCQDWTSCENILEGEYANGPYSDVINWNGMAVVTRKGEPTEKWYGRQMIRWCIDNDGRWNVGVEPRFYGQGAYAEVAKDSIDEILDKHGLGKYDYCVTPYQYDGYADTGTNSAGNIIYGNYDQYKAHFLDHAKDAFINEFMKKERIIRCSVQYLQKQSIDKHVSELMYYGTPYEFIDANLVQEDISTDDWLQNAIQHVIDLYGSELIASRYLTSDGVLGAEFFKLFLSENSIFGEDSMLSPRCLVPLTEASPSNYAEKVQVEHSNQKWPFYWGVVYTDDIDEFVRAKDSVSYMKLFDRTNADNIRLGEHIQSDVYNFVKRFPQNESKKLHTDISKLINIIEDEYDVKNLLYDFAVEGDPRGGKSLSEKLQFVQALVQYIEITADRGQLTPEIVNDIDKSINDMAKTLQSGGKTDSVGDVTYKIDQLVNEHKKKPDEDYFDEAIEKLLRMY